LLSAIWNYARQCSYTALNPCAGIKGNKETGRDAHIEDSVYQAVHDKADIELQDAMDLAYLTGQRVGNTLRMSEISRMGISGSLSRRPKPSGGSR
jgi:type VI protein secretion system component VasK